MKCKAVAPPTSGAQKQKLTRDDGSVLYGDEAQRAFSDHVARSQAEHARALRRLTPASRRAYATYKRTGTLPDATPAAQKAGSARESRGPAPTRRRGSSRRSSAKSGDSGDDGVGESSEPPPAGRPCECGCGQDVSHRAAQALYLNDRHAAADRQRRKRERDLLPGVPGLARACQCKPMRNPLEPGVCHQCGHARGRLTADWVHDPGPSSRQLVIRDLSRRKWKTSDGKRHKVEHREVEPRREVVA